MTAQPREPKNPSSVPPDQEAAHAKSGAFLLLMSAFIGAALWLSLGVALKVAPDSMRSNDRVYMSCFILSIVFGTLSALFVVEWLWKRFPRLCIFLGITVWVILGIGRIASTFIG